MKKIKVFLIFFFLFFVIGIIIEAKKTNYSSDKKYYDAINRTKQMVSNSNAIKLAQKHNLNILNITWEDTGRYKGSAVGPNISDMTIQVGYTDPKTQKFSIHLMPVIRFPNYSDLTADLSPSDFTLLVGNHNGKKLKRVSLYDFLKNIRLFLHNPKSWKGNKNSLLADRDTKVLVSAQACFLPVPKKGLALFNPVLFNYQSISGDPAVLTILVTREGTSVTVIDNKRDAFQSGSAWGQRLFHNEKGQRASLTGQRLSDYKASKKVSRKQTDKPKFQLNMVLLIQIPLKQKTPMRFSDDGAKSFSEMPMPSTSAEKSNVEAAVIGHGDLEGPFTEIDNLEIERDLRFPIRVTVQFYKATSNGVVSESDMASIKKEIDQVYAKGSAVGSLVVSGETGRVTEYYGSKIQPANWWNEFWGRYEKNMGISRFVAIKRLKKLLGHKYQYKPVSELYVRNLLKAR